MFNYTKDKLQNRIQRIKEINDERYERLYMNNMYYNRNNNRSFDRNGNYYDETGNAQQDQEEQAGEDEEEEADRRKQKDDEYSNQLMKMYPLGFNEIQTNDDGEEEEEDEDEDEVEIGEQNENINMKSGGGQQTTTTGKKFVTPRKKPREQKSNKPKTTKSNTNKSNKLGDDDEDDENAEEAALLDSEEEEEEEEQVKKEEAEEEEEDEEEEMDEEEAYEEGYEDESDRPPCIYNVWVQDCCRARRDFIYCQQLDLSDIRTREDFEKDMYEKGYMNCIDDYEDFMECLRLPPNRTLQGVETKFCVEIDVSDAFYGLNANRLRAYSFQGLNRKTVFSAFTYFRTTWTASMAIHSLQDYDVPFRPDKWYDDVILADKEKYKSNQQDDSGEGIEEDEEEALFSTTVEEEEEEEETEGEDDEEEPTTAPPEESGADENKSENTEKNENEETDESEGEKDEEEDDEDNEDNEDETNESNVLIDKNSTSRNNNDNIKVPQDYSISEIDTNSKNDNKNSITKSDKYKLCFKYIKYPTEKIKHFFKTVIKNDSDTTCTISNMAKLIDENNNRIINSRSNSCITSTTKVTDIMKTQYKITKYLLDQNDTRIPIWIKVDKNDKTISH